MNSSARSRHSSTGTRARARPVPDNSNARCLRSSDKRDVGSSALPRRIPVLASPARTLLAGISPSRSPFSMPEPEAELIAAIHAWDRAMISNDPVAIGQFMADDWVIVGPDGSVDGKERFLALIASGDLSHDVMESHELRVRLFGD